MTPRLFYRISSVLLVIFAIGHTVGFQHVDPRWNATRVVGAMKSITFPVQGFTRSYWDFFLGLGFLLSVFLLFSAVLAWRLGSVARAQLAAMTVERWAFAAAYVAIAVLSWRYLFALPDIQATLIALCLVIAAVLGGGATAGQVRSDELRE